MPRNQPTGVRSFWRRSRDWPVAGQIGFAIVIGLVVASFVGAISSRSGTKVAPTATTSGPSNASASTRAASTTTSTHPTSPTHATVAHTTTPRTAPSSTAPGLVSLTIAPASHQDTYSRSVDFGTWIDVHGCQDTRATLLIRTSQVPVTFTTSRDCTVKTGRWVDPWSGAVTTLAHAFQIDHTVPLANAWSSGAWAWTHDQRVAYANDLADPDHLVPILALENESKGDDGPDQWRPPARSAWCRYALDWDHIKAKWRLTATAAEWAGLRETSTTC